MNRIKLSLFLLLLIGILSGGLPPHQTVPRPGGEWVLMQMSPPPNRPQERGAQWWELRFENGKREYVSQKPGALAGLRRVYWHINDYKRIGGSLPRGGKIIGIDPNKIETFTYPLFWSGSDWLTEEALKKNYPQIYQALFQMALKQHRAVRRVQIQEQLAADIFKRKSEIAHIKSQLTLPNLTVEKKNAHEKRLKHLQKLLQHDQKLLTQPPAPQDEPAALVHALTATKEILKIQTRLNRETAAFEKLQKSAQKPQAKMDFLRQHLDVLQESLAKLKRIQAKVQENGLDLDI